MTSIDFYLIDHHLLKEKLNFACRLTEKAYRLNNTIYIQTDNAQMANQIDDLLWSFKADSFLPHHLSEGDSHLKSPIEIGFSDHAEKIRINTYQLMINLSSKIPAFFSRFDRVIEIVSNEASAKAQAREHYKYYKDRGYALNTHNLIKSHLPT